MSQKKDDYYNNINDMANVDHKTIMLKAKTKYKFNCSNVALDCSRYKNIPNST